MAKKTEAQVTFRAVTSEFTSGIKDINSSLKTMQNELKLNSAQLKNNGEDTGLLSQRQEILQRQFEATSQKIELTQQSLEEARRLLGENSTEYRNLENALLRAKTAQQNVQNEINQTSRRLDDLENSANDAEQDIDNLGNALEDLGDSADAADGGFTTLKGAMAEFTGNMLTKATEKLGEFISQLWELPEATEEYRTMMAKLEGSTEQNNYKIDEAKEKYTELYGYLKDDMAVTNCITNTQKMGLEQEQVNEVLDASVAVWTAYGDSIPIEGLTESITETAQVGQITGNLADALNWAGINEDKFNEQLAKCNSESERAKLITDALNGAYSESKRIYDENTEGMRESNEAQQELVDVQAQLAESILPVQTAITNVKVALLEALAPAIETVCNGITGLIDWFNGLSPAAQSVIQAIGIVAGAIGVVTGFVATFKALAPVLGLIKGAFLAVTGAIGALSTPVLIAIGVITSLIAIGTLLYKNWDTVKVKCSEAWNSVCNSIGQAKTNVLNSIEQIKSGISQRINTIKSVVTTGFNAVKTNIINPIKIAYDNVRNTFTNIYNTIRDKINNAKDTVKSAIDKIKGFMNFSWSLPKPKIPSFSVSGGEAPWGFGGKGSLPKISISWNALGGIFTQPTIFATPNGLQGVGEKGAEAILPLDSFYNHLDSKIDRLNNNTIDIDYDKLGDAVARSLDGAFINMDSKKVGKLVVNTVMNEAKNINRKLERFSGVY